MKSRHHAFRDDRGRNLSNSLILWWTGLGVNCRLFCRDRYDEIMAQCSATHFDLASTRWIPIPVHLPALKGPSAVSVTATLTQRRLSHVYAA